MAEVEPLFTHKFLENTEDHIVSAFIAGILEQL